MQDHLVLAQNGSVIGSLLDGSLIRNRVPGTWLGDELGKQGLVVATVNGLSNKRRIKRTHGPEGSRCGGPPEHDVADAEIRTAVRARILMWKVAASFRNLVSIVKRLLRRIGSVSLA